MIQLIEQQYVERAIKSGGLCDLTEFAPDGFPKQVAATTALWRSLLWSYPSSQIADFIDPGKLLREIDQDFFGPFGPSPDPIVVPFKPAGKPAWLSISFAITVYDHPAIMLITLPGETFPITAPSRPIVPAGLIVKITRLLVRFSHVARFHEKDALRKLSVHTLSLTEQHPLEKQLNAAHLAYSPSYPDYLSREEYRRLLIGELGQLLEISLGCELDPLTGSLLARHYDALCAPLNELLYVTRELLLLAAAVPKSSRPIAPIDHLVTTYSTLRKMLDESNPNIPKRLLMCLENDTVLISQLLPSEYAEELAELRQTLAVLQSIAGAFVTGVSYPPKFHLYH